MGKRRLITKGVLVRLKPCTYWRDPSTGRLHEGPKGQAGTSGHRPGSGAFRIPEDFWERYKATRTPDQRIFIPAGDEPEPD